MCRFDALAFIISLHLHNIHNSLYRHDDSGLLRASDGSKAKILDKHSVHSLRCVMSALSLCQRCGQTGRYLALTVHTIWSESSALFVVPLLSCLEHCCISAEAQLPMFCDLAGLSSWVSSHQLAFFHKRTPRRLISICFLTPPAGLSVFHSSVCGGCKPTSFCISPSLLHGRIKRQEKSLHLELKSSTVLNLTLLLNFCGSWASPSICLVSLFSFKKQGSALVCYIMILSGQHQKIAN